MLNIVIIILIYNIQNSVLYPNIQNSVSVLYLNIQINDDTLGTSYKTFSIYLKSQFVNIYQVACTIANCFVCENSN